MTPLFKLHTATEIKAVKKQNSDEKMKSTISKNLALSQIAQIVLLIKFMKQLLFFSVFLFVISSCQKCKVCECEAFGQTFEERKCISGTEFNRKKQFNDWEKSFQEEKQYDKVTCHYE